MDLREPVAREAFPAITGPIIQRAMRRGWQLTEERLNGAQFRKPNLVVGKRTCDVHVILTASREQDDRVWVHLSLSVIIRKQGIRMMTEELVVLPTWLTVCAVRDEILGKESKALMVVAPKSQHVNIEEVHHLWYCPEGDGLPDFTRGTGMI